MSWLIEGPRGRLPCDQIAGSGLELIAMAVFEPDNCPDSHFMLDLRLKSVLTLVEKEGVRVNFGAN